MTPSEHVDASSDTPGIEVDDIGLPTEAEMDASLWHVLDWTREMYSAMQGFQHFSVMRGTPLHRLHDATKGWADHHLRAMLISSLDHLASSNSILIGPPPIYACATLIRASMEASAGAVWILGAGSLVEAVQRTAQLELQSIHETHNFIDTVNSDDHATDRDRVYEWATKAGVSKSALKDALRTVRPHKLMVEASSYLGFETALQRWKLLSGVAHGYGWAIDAAAERAPKGFDSFGHPKFDLSPNKPLLFDSQLIALDLLNTAVLLWNRAARVDDDPNGLPIFTTPPSLARQRRDGLPIPDAAS